VEVIPGGLNHLDLENMYNRFTQINVTGTGVLDITTSYDFRLCVGVSEDLKIVIERV
jgi:hypothetical protein